MLDLTKLNKYPPSLCRVLAKTDDGYRMLTEDQIAKRAGLHRDTIRRISLLPKWDTLTLSVAVAYAMGCGINLARPRSSIYRKIRHSKAYFRHLTTRQRLLVDKLLPKTHS